MIRVMVGCCSAAEFLSWERVLEIWYYSKSGAAISFGRGQCSWGFDPAQVQATWWNGAWSFCGWGLGVGSNFADLWVVTQAHTVKKWSGLGWAGLGSPCCSALPLFLGFGPPWDVLYSDADWITFVWLEANVSKRQLPFPHHVIIPDFIRWTRSSAESSGIGLASALDDVWNGVMREHLSQSANQFSKSLIVTPRNDAETNKREVKDQLPLVCVAYRHWGSLHNVCNCHSVRVDMTPRNESETNPRKRGETSFLFCCLSI